MSNWQQDLYNKVPWALKELLVALEADRRNRYRRYGDYAAVRDQYGFRHYMGKPSGAVRAEQERRLTELVRRARAVSPFHRARLSDAAERLDGLVHAPVMTKADVRDRHQDILDAAYPVKALWSGLTSGSTGTPLKFPVAREGIRARYAIQDNYYELHGCRYGERRARFGGAKVVPVDASRPPFWILNRRDNQLQMSAYHIDQNTLPEYVRKLDEFAPRYVTGYGHAQYQVAAYLAATRPLRQAPRAVFTDSEGVDSDQREVIERGFGAPCYDVYGLGEAGWVAVQCAQRRYHVLELSCVLEAVDEGGRPVRDGDPGRLVVTDLTQAAFPYIRYDTGDIGSVARQACACGLTSLVLSSIEGRADDLVYTPRGRRVGRLSHVTKPGRGILESQIAQTAADRIVIRVVPTPNFDPASMTAVVTVARELLGDEMRVDWETVDSIPRTSRHKFKHVVREMSDAVTVG